MDDADLDIDLVLGDEWDADDQGWDDDTDYHQFIWDDDLGYEGDYSDYDIIEDDEDFL